MSPTRPGKRSRSRRPQLTDQQRRFCEELFRAPSDNQAALRAGYSPASSRSIAYSLKQKPYIKREIARLAALLEKDQGVSQRRIENELAAVGFSDLRDVASFGPDGVTLVSSAELEGPAAAALQEVQCEETIQRTERRAIGGDEDGEQIDVEKVILHRRVRVKLHSKLQALEVLARIKRYLKSSSPFGEDDEGGRLIPVPVLLPARRDA